MHPEAHAAMSGRDLMLSLAQELRSLHELARKLAAAPTSSDRSAVIAAQGQDVLEQTLDELAAFLARSADAFPDEPLPQLGPAFAGIRLAALARRLAGGIAAPVDAEGDMELF